jgi:hypothetical protein
MSWFGHYFEEVILIDKSRLVQQTLLFKDSAFVENIIPF